MTVRILGGVEGLTHTLVKVTKCRILTKSEGDPPWARYPASQWNHDGTPVSRFVLLSIHPDDAARVVADAAKGGGAR